MVVLAMGVMACGCQNDLAEVSNFENLDDGDAQVLMGARLTYSEEGIPTHTLKAKDMRRSSDAEGSWSVRDGFQLDVLGADGVVEASLSATRGTFLEEARFLQAEIDVQLAGHGGDTLYTELLFWSADSDRVHTPEPVEIRTPEGILRGRGLESDARFERYRILEPTGTFMMDTTQSPQP